MGKGKMQLLMLAAVCCVATAASSSDWFLGSRRLAGPAPVTVLIKSAGYTDGNLGEFHVNGVQLVVPIARGINILVLREDGSMHSFQAFDTHLNVLASEALASFLNGIADGTSVLIAAVDEAFTNLTPSAIDAIKSCGATQVHAAASRASYALAGIKGGLARAESLSLEGMGSVEIGAEYRAAVILEVRGGTQENAIAQFSLNGQLLNASTDRGVNVVILHPAGTLKKSYTFNTNADGSGQLAEVLNLLAPGTLVLIASQGEIAAALGSDAKVAMGSCGATDIDGLQFGASYALIGVKGGAKLDEKVILQNQGPAYTRALLWGEQPETKAMPLTIMVKSAGWEDVKGGVAEFYVSSKPLDVAVDVGINIVVLHRNGTVAKSQTFNTHEDGKSELLVAFVEQLSPGTLVLIAAKDEANSRLSVDARIALERCGSTKISNLRYRDAFALVGVKDGTGLAESHKLAGQGIAEVKAEFNPDFDYITTRTTTTTPVNLMVLMVRSAGWEDVKGGVADFYVNSKPLDVAVSVGINIVVLHRNGTVAKSRTFNTHEDGQSELLVEFVEELSPGTPVLIAAKDEANARLSVDARLALERCGSAEISNLRYRDAFALVGVKDGMGLAESHKLAGQGIAEITAEYNPNFDYITTRTTTATSTTTTPVPFCSVYDCPLGQILRVDAWKIRATDEGSCCEVPPVGVVNLMVRSAGYVDGNFAHFYVNGQMFSVETHRGINVASLYTNATLKTMRIFDTHIPGNSEDLADFLETVEVGTLLLIAAKDEAAGQLTSAAKSAIRNYCGARQIDDVDSRDSYALIAVKGCGSALAERHQPDGSGVAVAMAHYQADIYVSPPKPLCKTRVAEPPVKGWLTLPSRQLELEEGCRYPLWESPGITSCLQKTWMVVVGGSNTVLMAIQLANMLAPYAILPMRDQATMGGSTVVDIIIEGGVVVYRNSTKVSDCTAMRQDSACKVAIAAIIAAPPVYSNSSSVVRFTLLSAMFWDHAETALASVVADEGWEGAPIALLVQVSTWYIYCSAMKLGWCPRKELSESSISDEAALSVFQADMEPVLKIMDTLCVKGGRAEVHGCMVGTGSWQNPAASRLQFYKDYNTVILTAMSPRKSEYMRIIDFWTLGQVPGMGNENILGHGSPFLNIWNWQVMLGGMCPLELAAEGGYATFEGDLCEGADVQPAREEELLPQVGEKCPAYRDACPSLIRCQPWECANSVPCKLVAVQRQTMEMDSTGACRENVHIDLQTAKPSAPCHYVWCEDGIEILPTILAVLLASTMLLMMKFGSRLMPFVPERIRRFGTLQPPVRHLQRLRSHWFPSPPEPLAKAEKPASGATAQSQQPQAPSPIERKKPPTLIESTELSESTSNGKESETERENNSKLFARAADHEAPPPVSPQGGGGNSIKEPESPIESSAPCSPPVSPQNAVAVAIAGVAQDECNDIKECLPAVPAATLAANKIVATAKPKGAGDKFPLGLARFIGSTHVVVGHLWAKGVTPNVYFFQFGFTWVPWFFMLSGFVLFTAHLRRPKVEGVLEYVMRRSVTIYPLYAVSLLPDFVISKYFDKAPSAVVLIAQSWLVQAWWPGWVEQTLQQHCWFLSCMVVYWFCMKPLSHCLTSPRIALRGTIGLMVVLFAFPWLVVTIPAMAGEPSDWYKEHAFGMTETEIDYLTISLKFSPLFYFHVFVLGMLLAKLRLLLDARAVEAGLPRSWRLPMELVAPAGYLGLILFFTVPALRPPGYKLSMRLGVMLPFQAAILFGLAGLPSAPQLRIASFAMRLDFLADYSYAVYVFQWIAYKIWPEHEQVQLLLFLPFLYAMAVLITHLVQRPVQKWWGQCPRGRWCVPITLSILLGSLSFIDTSETQNPDLPALIRLDDRSVDMRLLISDPESHKGRLINPSLAVVNGEVVVAARRHSLETIRSSGWYNDNGTKVPAVIEDQTWYSQIVLGRASPTMTSWAGWPSAEVQAFQVQVSSWTGLRKSPADEKWAHLCVAETWVPENNTLIRRVITGPEDVKVFAKGDEFEVAFNSLRPLGADGCRERSLADVSQMYLASNLDPSNPAKKVVGRHLDHRHSDDAEKNWIPFTHKGRVYFVYSPSPHVVIAAGGVVQHQGDEACDARREVYETSFAPLQRLRGDYPGIEIRGSGQAVLVDDKEATPNLPRAHYLALIHTVDKRGRYMHFAYRFGDQPPFPVLQVSSQLPLQEAKSESAGGAAFAFASGLAVQNRTVAITYGAGDRDARVLVLTLSRLDEMFACSSPREEQGPTSEAGL